MTPPLTEAPPALDRAAVEALEGAARAATPGPWRLSGRGEGRWQLEANLPCINGLNAWFQIAGFEWDAAADGYSEGAWNPAGDAEYFHKASPDFILRLIADWKILADQNTLAFNHNRDLGASNDELRLRVHRLEVMLDVMTRAYISACKDCLRLDGEKDEVRISKEMDTDHLVVRARAALEGSKERG